MEMWATKHEFSLFISVSGMLIGTAMIVWGVYRLRETGITHLLSRRESVQNFGVKL
jgi:hypothetical protein